MVLYEIRRIRSSLVNRTYSDGVTISRSKTRRMFVMAKMAVTNGASPFRPRLRFGPMRARENSWGVSNLAERELARLKLTHPIQRGEQITEAQPLQDMGQVELSDIDHTY